MRRFFVDPENISGPQALLTGTEAKHIATVLRLAPGTDITLFDGSGSYYEARLLKISPSRVEARIVAITPYVSDAHEDGRASLHLGMGLMKGKKMELVIQKITELGIAGMHPFRSRYCSAHDPSANRLSRWQKIALSACKQCNRPKPPDLHEVTGFHDLLAAAEKQAYDLKLVFWEEPGQKSLAEVLGESDAVQSSLVLIGPEGGFSSDEVGAAIDAGFQPVSLGSRILRAETAALTAVSILQYELGNLS